MILAYIFAGLGAGIVTGLAGLSAAVVITPILVSVCGWASYDAVTVAQMTLTEASAQLQRRFSPRISARTQQLMARLTGGRYDRVRLGEDLTLQAGAQREDVLRDVLWRSEGTVDQLYFALRLAVAEELAPQAPLVLDDALVRFDDKRLKNALEVLKEQAQRRQVILFSCHGREKAYLEK